MELKDIVFSPHNDMSADNKDLISQHQAFVDTLQYSDAADLLNENNYNEGFRASLFNAMKNKIHTLQTYFLNKFAAEEDEFYSYTEPTEEQMEGKTWWIQPY